MAQNSNLRGQYAPSTNVLAVFQRMRDRGLPETIDNDTLGAIGIPEGNQPRVLATLKFLGVVSESNERTELFERIGRASTTEYPELLAEILRSAYAPVFQIVDMSKHSIDQITDAFRQYEPAAQRARMVSLFMGLCAEANIVAAEAVTARRAATAPARRSVRTGGGGQQQARNQRQKPPGSRFAAIHTIVDELPDDGVWSERRRKRWMRMMEAAVDFAIEVAEERALTEEEAEAYSDT